MKLKKLFAGIVAVAMMATMAIPVFATQIPETDTDNGTNTTIESNVTNGNITLTKEYKNVNAATTSQAETFTFVIKSSTDPSKKTTTLPANGLVVSTSSALTAGGTTAAAGAISTGTATIPVGESGLNITKPGVYYYTVTENDGGKQGVDYDDRALNMKVTAGYKNDNDDFLTYWVALSRTDENGKEVKTNDKFENTYSAGTLEVRKNIVGLEGDRAKKFDFKIVFSGVAGTTFSGKLGETDYNITIPDSGSYTLDGFQMTDESIITFTNVPYGVTYTIYEKPENYSATVDKNALTQGEDGWYYYSSTGEGVNVATARVTVTNALGGTVDTGVILDNAPYIALLTIVAAGAVVMIMKKRRNYED